MNLPMNTPMDSNEKLILIIDDEPAIRESYRNFLEDCEYQVAEAENGKKGIELLEAISPDLVLVDLRMPEVDGLEVLSHVMIKKPDLPIIVASGTGVISDIVEAIHLGAWDYLLKPVDLQMLKHAVDKALERSFHINERSIYQKKLEAEVKQRTADLENTTIALQKSVADYEFLAANLKDMVLSFLPDGTITYCSPVIIDFGMYLPEDVVGDTIENYIRGRSEKESAAMFITGMKQGINSGSWEFMFIPSEKMPFPVEISAKPILKNGNLESVHCVIRDISERKKAEAELTLLMTAIEQAVEIFIITNIRGGVEYVNPAFEDVTGYCRSDICGQSLSVVESSGDMLFEGLKQVAVSGREYIGQVACITKKGDGCELEVTLSPVKDENGQPVNVVIVARDVTSEIRLENQLRQAQKIESIGTLAGGIAHDFNNILSAIMGYSQIAMHHASSESKIYGSLTKVIDASERAKELIRQILTFSKPSDPNPQPVKISLIVKETIKLLRASMPSSIKIKQRLDAKRDTVNAEPTQIHQIIMNLCTNALHAMKNEGVLEVALSVCQQDTVSEEIVSAVETEDYLRLSIIDSGCGMDSSTLEQIFDPYFTTKEKGEGTGLGLAVVHGIVKNHGGEIVVKSKLGEGTAFDIYMPLIKEKEATLPIMNKRELITGKGRLLFVDDEKVLAEMGKEMLENIGYKVDTSVSSIDALEKFKEDPAAYDAVITDYTMPNMTGEKLAKEILKCNSKMPVIICTGYSEGMSIQTNETKGVRAVLMKPVAMNDLAVTLNKVLEPESQTPLA